MVWTGDRAPEAVVHEWLWQSRGLWVASRGFCSSCEMRVGAVGARCVRAASPTHALEHGVLSRSPSAAERRSPTSCNANSKSVCLSACLSVCLATPLRRFCTTVQSAKGSKSSYVVFVKRNVKPKVL